MAGRDPVGIVRLGRAAEAGDLVRRVEAHRQLVVRESRREPARGVCHGRRGTIRRADQGRPAGRGQVVRGASNSARARAQTAPGSKVSELQVAEVSSPLPRYARMISTCGGQATNPRSAA